MVHNVYYIQTGSPTSFCATLAVNVMEVDGESMSHSEWDGVYVLESQSSFGLDQWSTTTGQWMKHMDSYWVLSSANGAILTYSDDGEEYPPIDTVQWNQEGHGDGVTVTIECSLTYPPSGAPTTSPTNSPVE